MDRDSDRQADRVGWTHTRTGQDEVDKISWVKQDIIMSCSDSGSDDVPVGAQVSPGDDCQVLLDDDPALLHHPLYDPPTHLVLIFLFHHIISINLCSRQCKIKCIFIFSIKLCIKTSY